MTDISAMTKTANVATATDRDMTRTPGALCFSALSLVGEDIRDGTTV